MRLLRSLACVACLFVAYSAFAAGYWLDRLADALDDYVNEPYA